MIRRVGAAERRLLGLLCDRSKISIDIGANVGTLTYYLARHSAHVYAYEPNPELAAKLRRGFGSNVSVVEAALSDAPGTAVLKLPAVSRRTPSHRSPRTSPTPTAFANFRCRCVVSMTNS